jgi:hypothetical protein
MKLIRLIKVCLNETYSKFHTSNHLSDKFHTHNVIKQGDALLPLLLNFAFQYFIMEPQVNQMEQKLN